MNTAIRLGFLCVLSILLTMFALRVVADEAKEEKKPAEVPRISVEEFAKMREKPEAVVLDVRTTDEFSAGHVPGAVNLPINDPEFKKKVADLDKGKTYLVHCAVGVRSARACKTMRGDFKSLFDFSGGFEAWKNAGKPVEKSAQKKKTE